MAARIPSRNPYLVEGTESSLAAVWNGINVAAHSDVQRSHSECGEHAIAGTEVTDLAFVGGGLQPDSVYH